MLIPAGIGRFLDRLLPRGLSVILHRAYDPYHRWSTGRRSRKLVAKIFNGNQLEVVAGPFSGMKYFPLSRGSALLPKLLGAYERELHPALQTVLAKKYTTIIDVGCAEGFYVVGLARKVPHARVHGFDLDRNSLAACQRLAELNQVSDRVSLHERCTHDALRRLVDDRTLIVCDCEGFEVELLDPNRVPALRQADILVELHDRLVPYATQIVTHRFVAPQRVTLISTLNREPKAYPLLASLSLSEQHFALDEFRGGPMEWAFIEGVKRDAAC
jgi:hypothetical protein